MQPNRIVSREEWVAARKAHLRNEKALTRMRDMIAAERRALPWVRVEKDYVFDAPEGKVRLADLFGDHDQLIVHHFMLGPGWGAGCPSCSLEADHGEPAVIHLENHGVSFVRVSRAPIGEIEAYRRRMGWKARWVSSFGSDFNFDYGVSFTEAQMKAHEITYNYETGPDFGIEELPGVSVFAKDDAGAVFHTYSSYARGNEEVMSVFMFFDMTPKGRDETTIMDWVRRHDEYDRQIDDAGKPAARCCSNPAHDAA